MQPYLGGDIWAQTYPSLVRRSLRISRLAPRNLSFNVALTTKQSKKHRNIGLLLFRLHQTKFAMNASIAHFTYSDTVPSSFTLAR
jgi:hypothetical protein